MSSVRDNIIVPLKEMPLIQVDSLVLTSLIDKTKNIMQELETILNHQSNSSIQSKTIIVRKPIDLLRQIENSEFEDPYDYLLKLADALSIYEKTGDKIGNDFKHLFEKLFVKACLQLKKEGEKNIEGCIGLNTVFLLSVVKVRDIKWLLYLITIYHGESQLFKFTKEHAEIYSKIGSRDCQIYMNKLVKDSYGLGTRLIFDIIENLLVVEKNLEECKKLISYGANIYMRANDACIHSNCLEECYKPYKKNIHSTESWCFSNIHSAELYLIKSIIEKFDGKDFKKSYEAINWLVYEYPSRIGHIVKTEQEGKEYLLKKIKNYCIENTHDFYNLYCTYEEKKSIINLSENDFYIDKSNKNDSILCCKNKEILFVMFYHDTTLLYDFNQLTNAGIDRIKFGTCNLLQNNITHLKNIPSFILYIEGRPALSYEGERNQKEYIKFLKDILRTTKI
jgi:hypothetical protein